MTNTQRVTGRYSTFEFKITDHNIITQAVSIKYSGYRKVTPSRCARSFLSACEKLECELIEMDGEEDHVHLLIAYPPKLATPKI
jgi:REP element-mobilizing transposase RayT